MITITENEVYSTEGKYVHRIGTDAYFKHCSKLPNDTEEMFEEVDEVPECNPEDDVFKQQTEGKVKAMFFVSNISSQINTFNLTNKEALAVMEYYPEWTQDSGDIKVNEKYKCDGVLWECVKGHTAQANWKPSLQTASLWKVVDEEHEGTEDDPIPYTPPMEIYEGKYYTQSEAKYKCTRNSDIPLTHNLIDLVGTYVETIN